jgi:plasmid stability protein
LEGGEGKAPAQLDGEPGDKIPDFRLGPAKNIHPGGDSEPLPINLSIKNAPDDVVQRLRERAERHHRSLQGELMAILEAAVREDGPAAPADILAEVRRLGVSTPSEAAAIIRADRDAR